MGLLLGVAAEGGVVGGLVGIPGQGNTRNHLLLSLSVPQTGPAVHLRASCLTWERL